jgi:hypothetical protein
VIGVRGRERSGIDRCCVSIAAFQQTVTVAARGWRDPVMSENGRIRLYMDAGSVPATRTVLISSHRPLTTVEVKSVDKLSKSL